MVPDGAVFHADWEARLFALTEVASLAGITRGHFRQAIESMAPGAYLAASYYERWLFGLERRLERAGTLAPEDVERAMTRLGTQAMPVRRNPAFAARAWRRSAARDPLPPAAAPRFVPASGCACVACGRRVIRAVRGTCAARSEWSSACMATIGWRTRSRAARRHRPRRSTPCGSARLTSSAPGREPPFHVMVDLSESYLEEPA